VRRWVGLLRSFVVYRRLGRQRGLRQLYGPFVSAGDLVFDVGAHLGDRSAAFSSLGARVIALEPQPHVATWLERWTGRDPRITVLREAVGRAPGKARLAVSRANPTVSTLSEGFQRDVAAANPGFRSVRWDESVEVPLTTLDALIERYGIPSFVKLDVEGWEAEALAGLSQAIRAVSFEFVTGATQVGNACVLRLLELGSYEFNVVPGEGRKFVFDAWRTGDEIARWLDAGTGGISSGDVYARLVGSFGGPLHG